MFLPRRVRCGRRRTRGGWPCAPLRASAGRAGGTGARARARGERTSADKRSSARRGLLIAKDNTILVERYQYGRTDTDRLTSFSMAKSMVGLLIGIALKEGAIRSLDDLAEAYVPGLRETEYGRTPIKALLLMSSGIAFSEDYANTSSDIYTLARLTLEQDPGGS